MAKAATLESMAVCRERRDCRLCGSRALVPVLSLAPTPPANGFLAAADLDKAEPSFPLEVHMCAKSC